MITVFRMSSHCVATEQVKKERKRVRNCDEREKRWDWRQKQKVEWDEAVVTCNGRLFHRRADATENTVADGRQPSALEG